MRLSRRSFLPLAGLLAGSLPFAASGAEPPPPLLAYVGTYSSPLHTVPKGQVDLPAGNGKGIHIFQVDRTTGKLTPCGLAEIGTSPSHLVANAAGTCMYSANETDAGEGGAGSVTAWKIDRTTGGLSLLNTVSSGAAGPTYVSLDPSGRFLLAANYFGGAVTVFPIQPDGRLGALSDLKKATGAPGPKRATNAPPGSFAFSGHETPHAHMVRPDPAGRFIFSVDLGRDRLLSWKLDAATGTLTANEPAEISFPPGDGPRHFAFHPGGHWLYSLQEEGSTITVFDYDAAAGRLTQRQMLSSLPPGYAGSSFASEIEVSPDGHHVYAGNRLHDGIAWFTIGNDGTLTWAGEEWTHGDYPRSFSFDPTGRFLYSCNQRADHVTSFRVDPVSGALTFTGQYTPVGNPSYILFLDLAAATPGSR